MQLKELLSLFTALDKAGIEYVVTGSLSRTLRGDVSLTEAVTLVVASHRAAEARRAAVAAWAEAMIADTPAPSVAFRILPSHTPFYVDVLTGDLTSLQPEIMNVHGVQIATAGRELRDGAAGIYEASLFVRQGFTTRERLDALNALVRELGLSPAQPRGVRKYRSFEAAIADRERARAMRSRRAD
jgi:hypothetical protein